mmetsp:Transcript_28170/g.42139  ORF Transcript_28170/g.42139 Transcript_28170/m.42139 type:complete len:207 (+) Transcript_28170:1754-2374(+)
MGPISNRTVCCYSRQTYSFFSMTYTVPPLLHARQRKTRSKHRDDSFCYHCAKEEIHNFFSLLLQYNTVELTTKDRLFLDLTWNCEFSSTPRRNATKKDFIRRFFIRSQGGRISVARAALIQTTQYQTCQNYYPNHGQLLDRHYLSLEPFQSALLSHCSSLPSPSSPSDWKILLFHLLLSWTFSLALLALFVKHRQTFRVFPKFHLP